MGKLIAVGFLHWFALGFALDAIGGGGYAAAESGHVTAVPGVAMPKVTLGFAEKVMLQPWGVSIPARIDTGADLSSLDARDLVVRADVADFKLGKDFGGLRLKLPVIEWQYIQTSMGVEKRPVVEVAICLGARLIRTPVTLKDRTGMMYPLLVGRSALSGGFLVDSSVSNAAPPVCPAPSAS